MLYLLLSMTVIAEVSIKAYIGDSLINESKGITIFDEKLNIYINIKKPIQQKFFYKGDTLILYYPNEGKAFYFSRYNPMNFSITQVVIGSRENFDLSLYGYRFLMKKKVADTLNTYWVPEKDKSGSMIHFKILEGRLKSIFVEKGDSILLKTEYKNYVSKDEWSVPSKIVSYSYISSPETKEYVELSNIKFISAFPESLRNIKLPEGIKIRKW